MAAPAGAGSCRTGRRPRSGACSSTVGDAAPVPGAPRDAHGSAPCAFGETGHGPHGVGMIVDRAGLDWMGPRSMPPSVPDRPVRPTAKGAEPSSDSVPFIVCDYARSFFILLAAFL